MKINTNHDRVSINFDKDGVDFARVGINLVKVGINLVGVGMNLINITWSSMKIDVTFVRVGIQFNRIDIKLVRMDIEFVKVNVKVAAARHIFDEIDTNSDRTVVDFRGTNLNCDDVFFNKRRELLNRHVTPEETMGIKMHLLLNRKGRATTYFEHQGDVTLSFCFPVPDSKILKNRN